MRESKNSFRKRIAGGIIGILAVLLLTSTSVIVVSAQETYNTAFLTDTQLEDYNSMSAIQIQAFLASHNSYFQQSITDVDGQTFDPSVVIAQAANQYRINPKVILATLEKESSGVSHTIRPSDTTMSFLMGCLTPNTARQQLTCAAERFRAYQDQLTNTGSTISGWQVGVVKTTTDGVTVTPATKAVAGQFTYTPYAGAQWGGNQPKVGGVYLFYSAWNSFGFGGSSAHSSKNIGYVNYDDSGFTASSGGGGNIFSTSIIGGPSPTSSNTASVTYNGMTFTPLKKADISTANLNAFDTLILFEVCDISTSLTPVQHTAINDYLAAGNKILLFDADRCAPGYGGDADYSWFTYPFKTSNPGPGGRTGTLTVVEDSTLTNGLASDPFNGDELGDANTATTSDTHWFASAKTTNALGNNGYFLAYARNSGLIIYDGADRYYTISQTKSLTDLFLNELNQQFNPDNLPGTTRIALDDFKQNVDPWQNIRLGTRSDCPTIGAEGCALTSATDVLSSYGYKTLKNGKKTDPQNLNEYLGPGGFNTKCWIYWAKASAAVGLGSPTVLPALEPDGKTISVPWPQRQKEIDDALKSGDLAIVSVMGGGHWVVLYQAITDVNGNSIDYRILDPYLRSPDRSGKTLSESTYGTLSSLSTTMSVVHYKDKSHPTRTFVFIGHSPIEFLVTDPNGVQTGFDSKSGKYIDNIPDSNYGLEPGLVDDQGILPPLPDSIYFQTNNAIDGTYKLQVIGTGTGPYTLDFLEVDENSNSTGQSITGIAAPGKIDTYIVSSQSGQPIKIQPVHGSISGTKFNDSDSNGIREVNESGLANWTITLKNETGNVSTTLTDVNGNYSFTNLSDGNYTVGEVQQNGWTQTAPATGTYNVTITGGSVIIGKDFGNVQNVVVKCDNKEEKDKDKKRFDEDNKKFNDDNKKLHDDTVKKLDAKTIASDKKNVDDDKKKTDDDKRKLDDDNKCKDNKGKDKEGDNKGKDDKK